MGRRRHYRASKGDENGARDGMAGDAHGDGIEARRGELRHRAICELGQHERQRPRMARSASAMRPGSSVRSIATIFAPVIVNAMRVIGLPSAAWMTPTAPLISAGRVIWAESYDEPARNPGEAQAAVARLVTAEVGNRLHSPRR